MVRQQGLEPGTRWLRVSCSTNWAIGANRVSELTDKGIKMVTPGRIELPISPWEGDVLAAWPRGHILGKKLVFPQIRKRAGTYLFSQVVSNQVSSARSSLTTVFGMGTGGTSTSSAPAMNVLKAIALSLALTYSLFNWSYLSCMHDRYTFKTEQWLCWANVEPT